MFYQDVQGWVALIIFLVTVVLELIALFHCLVQRKDAFTVVGSIPKWGWALILFLSLLVTLVLRSSILAFLALTATAFYLLDVRIGLRDVSGGSGRWR